MGNQKIKLYVADNNRNTITPIEANRVSESSYWIGENRYSFNTQYKVAFFIRRDAKDYLISYHAEKIAQYEMYIVHHEKIIDLLERE
jgi:hypothetical protein